MVEEQTPPPGALPEEVADKVDAKLSPGEYVIPANILRFYGLKFFENLKDSADKKLAEMDEAGRMGGESGEDDLPFRPEELQTAEAASETPAFAEGGLVAPPGQNLLTYKGVNGDVMYIPTIGGQPMYPPPEGYTLQAPITPTTPAPVISKDQRKAQLQASQDDDKDPHEGPTGTAGSVDKWSMKDYENYGKQITVGAPINAGIEKLIGGFIPFGGKLVEARKNYLSNAVPENITKMLESGKDNEGNTLTESQRTQLTEIMTEVSKPVETEGPKGAVATALGGLFEALGITKPKEEPAPLEDPNKATAAQTDVRTSGPQEDDDDNLTRRAAKQEGSIDRGATSFRKIEDDDDDDDTSGGTVIGTSSGGKTLTQYRKGGLVTKRVATR